MYWTLKIKLYFINIYFGAKIIDIVCKSLLLYKQIKR